MPVETSSSSIIGQLLNDRYRVISKLGEGGMGQTYVAEDIHLPSSPKCVVKQLKPATGNPDVLINIKRLFNGEAEVLDRLGHHDQIPKLLAYFDQDQEFYLVQEFIDGHPLSTELPLGQRWSEVQVIQLLESILQILEFVHSQNTIHRDIKPDNIMRRQQDDKLVLIDFGAVKQLSLQRSPTTGYMSQTVGIVSPGYTPTEQSRGTPRPNSDLYALGIVAIQALTGLSPILLREDDDGEVIWRDQADVSDELANFLTKMVRYHFKQRYKTATEALEALQQIVTSSSIHSASPSTENPLVAHSTPPNAYSETQVNPHEVSTEKTVKFEIPMPSAASQDFSHKDLKPRSDFEDEELEELPESSIASRFLIGGLVIALTGVLASGGHLAQRYMQRQEWGDRLTEIQQLKNSGDYSECINQTEVFPQTHSDMATKVETLRNECKSAQAQQLLVEAQALAERNSFLSALNLLEPITPDVASYEQAQSLIRQWAGNILIAAENKYQAGDLETAIAWANAIPESNLAHEDAQEAIANWQQNWQQQEDAFNAAQTALNQGDWDATIANLDKLTLEHWKQRGQPIRARAVDEQILQRAQTLSNDQRWTAAIEEARKVTTDYGKEKAAAIIAEAERKREEYLHPINVTGQLSESLPSQTYSFSGSEGDRFEIMLNSSEFDTVLSVIDEDGQEVGWNDDSQNGTNSALTLTLPHTGSYRVRVSSYYSSSYGQFALSVRRSRR